MGTDPNPDVIATVFNGQNAMGQPDASRPVLPNLLKM